jgi:periplasmic divalent cation tolerance protein
MNKKSSVIVTTTNKKETATCIANILIESKLAACVQLDEIISFFNYEDRTFTEREFRLMIKAPSKNYETIEKLIKNNHNYELPQIIGFKITHGLPEYINWIHKS